MSFGMFKIALLEVTMAAFVISGVHSVEYRAWILDCKGTSSNQNVSVNQNISYNITTAIQCISLCLSEKCSYVKYEGGVCERTSIYNYAIFTSQLTWDIYRLSNVINVAGPDKVATQSSTYGSYVAAYAIDGDTTTLSNTNNDVNPWLMVDLKQNYMIKELRFLLSFQLLRFTNIQIYLSNSLVAPQPSEYSLLPVFATFVGPPPITTVTFTAQFPLMCGRYLIVQRMISGAQSYLEMLNLDIFAVVDKKQE